MNWGRPAYPFGERARDIMRAAGDAATLDDLLPVARRLDRTPLPEREERACADVVLSRARRLAQAELARHAVAALNADCGAEVWP